jgi:glutamate 5-kinase
VGTWFSVNSGRKSVRMMWLAHLAHVQGRLLLDNGAVKAVRDKGASLLPAGITAVEGHFESGDAVEMVAPDGTVIARGLVNYSADELPQMLGRSTVELGESLGRGFDREVVHVDDLVLV